MSKAVAANPICSGLEEQITAKSPYFHRGVKTRYCIHPSMLSAFASLRLRVSFVTEMEIPHLYKEYNLC